MLDRLVPQSRLLSKIQQSSRVWFGRLPHAARHAAGPGEVEDEFSPRYWDVAGLEEAVHQSGGPLLLEVASCKVEFVADPAGDGQSAMWLPVMVFHGRQRRLIIDNAISQVLSHCTRSRLVLAWGQVGRVALLVKQTNGRKQIVVKPIGTRPLYRYQLTSPPL